MGWVRFLRRRRWDAERAWELESYLQIETDENIARGMTPEDARAAARRKLGNSVLIREEIYGMNSITAIDNLGRDIRYALRAMGRNRAFTAVVVMTLGLVIGANTAIFSFAHAVLLRPLPVERPQELVFLRSAGSEGTGGTPPYPWFERLRGETSSFSGVAAFAADELRGQVDGEIEQVFGQVASGSYFDVLGLKPAAGRLLTMDDERLDPPVAVIGYGYWQRRFGGDPAAIGRTISLGIAPLRSWESHPSVFGGCIRDGKWT